MSQEQSLNPAEVYEEQRRYHETDKLAFPMSTHIAIAGP